MALRQGMTDSSSAKKAYHHGELRQTLIDAARALVSERGNENFSLADACRRAGVTTAAPYRHFADKYEILAEVAAQGFDDMRAKAMQAAQGYPEGDPNRIIAIGRLYVTFAVAEPALFRLMFGQKSDLTHPEKVKTLGASCFAYVVDEVVRHCAHNAIPGDATMIAVQLWTVVHGMASLTIDGDYAKVVPEIDIEVMMANAAERLLFSRGGVAPGSDAL